MANQLGPGPIYKLTTRYSDPDEVCETVAREHSPVKFTAPVSGVSFDFEIQIARVGEMLCVNGTSESGYRAKYEGLPVDAIAIQFIDAGQFNVERKSGRPLQINRGECFIHRVRDIESSKHLAAIDQKTIFFPVSRFAGLVASELDDPLDEFRKLAPVIGGEWPQSRILRGISDILSAKNEIANPLNDAPLGAALLQEALLAVLIETWPRSSGDEAKIYSPRPKHIKRATDWIHAHLDQKIQLEDIALAAGASVRTVQIGFQKQYGTSPVAYIVKCRLQRVHHDLLNAPPTRSVSEIANAWGFFHLGEFAAKYKRMYGTTPSETKRIGAGKN